MIFGYEKYQRTGKLFVIMRLIDRVNVLLKKIKRENLIRKIVENNKLININ